MTAIVTLRRLSREMQLSDGLATAPAEVCGVSTKIVSFTFDLDVGLLVLNFRLSFDTTAITVQNSQTLSVLTLPISGGTETRLTLACFSSLATLKQSR